MGEMTVGVKSIVVINMLKDIMYQVENKQISVDDINLLDQKLTELYNRIVIEGE